MIDIFGEVGVRMGGLVGLLGRMGLKGPRDDKITPYSVKYS